MDNQEFTLAQQIAKLQGTVEEGFRGVHARQDITNGRVGKCELRLSDLEKDGSKNQGIQDGKHRVVTLLKWIAGFVVAGLTMYFTFKR